MSSTPGTARAAARTAAATSGGVGVHEVRERLADESHPVADDDRRREDGCGLVGSGPVRAADQRDYDAAEGRQRGDGVGAVVPGVGVAEAAAGEAGRPPGDAVHRFLDRDHEHQHHQREARRYRLRAREPANPRRGDADARGNHQQGHAQGGEGLDLPVAEGVVLIGRPRPVAKRPPHHERPSQIHQRFDRVGDEGEGVAHDPGHQLHHGQGRVDQHAEHRGPLGGRAVLAYRRLGLAGRRAQKPTSTRRMATRASSTEESPPGLSTYCSDGLTLTQFSSCSR